MIVFNASEEQIYQLYKMAVQCSQPVGMGWAQHEDGYVLSREDFESFKRYDGSYHADYVKGRMVKLYVKNLNEHGEGRVICRGTRFEEAPDIEYQSFAKKYSTWPELLKSVGITDWKQIDEECDGNDCRSKCAGSGT